METGVFVLALIRQFWVIAIELFPATVIFLTYRLISQNSLLKKISGLWISLFIFDLLWVGVILCKINYRFWISDIPQPLLLFLSRCNCILWPVAIFLFTLFLDWTIAAETKLHKRHYALGACAVSLMLYFLYLFYTQEIDPAKPWVVLGPSGWALGDIFIFISRCCTLIYGLKRLVVEQVSGIIRQQTKWVLCLMTIPAMFLQPIWLLQICKVIPAEGFWPELCSNVLAMLVGGLCVYGNWRLFRLRFFNVYPAVHGKYQDVTRPLAVAMDELRGVTVLQQLGHITGTYFEKAFGFKAKEVNLYIRPTHHELNEAAARAVETLPAVEELFGVKEKPALCEKIFEKRILLHSEVQYEELYELNEDAKQFRIFLEANNAEVFLPICKGKELIAYIIIERNARGGKLVVDGEIPGMTAYADLVSYIVRQLQQLDPEVADKERLTYKYQALQLFQERQLCHEGIRSIMKEQTSEAVSMVFLKNKNLHVANAEGKEMLGLPEETDIITNEFEQPLKRSLYEFKKYQKDDVFMLKNPQNDWLRFSVMKDSRQNNAVVIVSRATVSEQFKFPSVEAIPDRDDWDYALFLKTTSIGRIVEQAIPATQGALVDFKIKFLRAVLSRRPLLLQGKSEDFEYLVSLMPSLTARTCVHKMSLKQPEQNHEEAHKLFGMSTLVTGTENKGYLATFSTTGVIGIEHVERLSLETQEQLAYFFATGRYAPSYSSRQFTSSEALFVFGSTSDLEALVENKQFSKALYEEIKKNILSVPALTTLSTEELHDCIETTISQVLGEMSGTQQLVVSSEEVEALANQNFGHFDELRQRVKAYIEARQIQQTATVVVPAKVVEVNITQEDSVVEQARRFGKAALRNRKFFDSLYSATKSTVRIAEILGVNYSTAYRTCRKYKIGSFAPGAQRKRGRPRSTEIEH